MQLVSCPDLFRVGSGYETELSSNMALAGDYGSLVISLSYIRTLVLIPDTIDFSTFLLASFLTPPNFPFLSVRTASDGKLGGRLLSSILLHTSLSKNVSGERYVAAPAAL